MKDKTILIIAGGAGIVLLGAGYMIYRAVDRAAGAAEKTSDNAKEAAATITKKVDDVLAIPGDVAKAAQENVSKNTTVGTTSAVVTEVVDTVNPRLESATEHNATQLIRQATGGSYNSYATPWGNVVGNVSTVAQQTGDARADPNYRLTCVTGYAKYDNSEGLGYSRWHCVATKPTYSH